MLGRTQDTDSAVAPYRCKCVVRASLLRPSEARHRASRKALTWEFSGADDGIRTRDPHLGKKKPTIEAKRPACTFTSLCSKTDVFE